MFHLSTVNWNISKSCRIRISSIIGGDMLFHQLSYTFCDLIQPIRFCLNRFIESNPLSDLLVLTVSSNNMEEMMINGDPKGIGHGGGDQTESVPPASPHNKRLQGNRRHGNHRLRYVLKPATCVGKDERKDVEHMVKLF